MNERAKLMPLTAVAETLGVSVETARSMVKKGRLPHTRVGALIMVPRAAVEAMVRGERTIPIADLVRYRWDSVDPAREGWFAEWYRKDRLIGHSEQADSPVDLDGFTAGQEQQVRSLLQALCPNASVEAQ